MAQNKGRKAWLITWETTGEHVRSKKRGGKKYAAILNPQWRADIVCCIMESLLRYEDQVDLKDWLEYAKVSSSLTSSTRKKLANQRLAERGGGSYRYICGEGLYLAAQRVEDLRVIEDEKGRESLVWKDWQYKERRSKNRKSGTLPLKLYGEKSSEAGKEKKRNTNKKADEF